MNMSTHSISLQPSRPEVVEDLPLEVVPDWEDQVRRADALCRLIDRHLDYEARERILRALGDFRPEHLCPEQRVQMVTDVLALSSTAPSRA
jgi:hypothetical protein